MERILDVHFDKWTPAINGCYVWTAAISSVRRPMVGVAGNKTALVSRLVCEETHGPPPTSKHRALHATPYVCIGELCVNGAHLRWGTARDNALDEPAEKRREWSKCGGETKAARGNQSNMRKERWAAIQAGESEYYSSKPCKRGHFGPFRVKGDCIQCVKIRNASRDRR
jgi:hypothetical protein